MRLLWSLAAVRACAALRQCARRCRALAPQVRILERTKLAKKATLENMLAESMETCLADPFIYTAANGHTGASAALAQAWITAMSSLAERELLSEAGLIEMGIMVRPHTPAARGSGARHWRRPCSRGSPLGL